MPQEDTTLRPPISHNWKDGATQQVTLFFPNESAPQQTLEVLTIGPSPQHAPTILLLHEGLGCVSLWRDFPQQLQQLTGFGVLAYSRAGYGSSSPIELPRPLDYMSQEAATSLPAIMDTFALQKTILLGHSDGASIAGLYAGNTVDARIRALILMAPHFFTEGPGLAAIEKARDDYNNSDLRERLAKYHDNVDMAFLGWNTAWLDADFVAWNIADSIDHWRIPVLAIQGGEDQYGTLAQINEIETRCPAPLELAILDDCEHAPHLQQTEATLAAIDSFVTTLSAMEDLTALQDVSAAATRAKATSNYQP